MGHRSHWRFRKFYEAQVEEVLRLLTDYYKEGQIPLDTYFELCEQRGVDPVPEEMPPTMGDFPYEVQVAFLLHDLLPDRWDGMSGSYFGKDLSALGTLLDTWDIEDKKSAIYWIKHIESKNSEKINGRLERKRKAAENKAKGPGINSANIKR